MKKIYSLLLTCAALTRLDAQVVVNVLDPPGLIGDYTTTWADPAQGWGTPDMTILANAVTDTLALAYSISPTEDSLVCDTVMNAAEIRGKIAVLYRGTCNFSLKALFCQDSGAVAVVIINNVPANPIAMGAGTYGASVTIPTFLIEQAGGQVLAAALAQGTTITAYLGNKTGLFDFDLGFYNQDMLTPPAAAVPALLCQNASEYSPVLGAWIHNYGNQDQTNVTLNATITHNGSEVYSQTSTPVALIAAGGDSVFVELPAFSQSSYSGFYRITYTAASPAAEEYTADNTFVTTLYVEDLYSFAEIDSTSHLPVSQQASAPSTPGASFTYCAHFQNANASRVAATGLQVFAAVNTPNTLNGEILRVSVNEWLDDFTGLSDGNFAITTLNELTNAEYIVDVDTTRWRGFIPFSAPVVLQDNVRYLFCLATDDPSVVFLGSDDNLDYTENEAFTDQPSTPLQNGATWSVGFAGTQSSNAVRMIDVNSIGIQERPEVVGTPYPNPTRDLLRIPMKGRTGNATLGISDMDGAQLSIQQVHIENGIVEANMNGIASGTYMVSMAFADGSKSTFRVVVNK